MEDEMAALKSLTFTTLPPSADPTLDRRATTIARLEEQKLLQKDPNYTRTVRTWVRKGGEKSITKTASGISPWWRLKWVEANRVRERKDRDCSAVLGQAAIRDRHADFRDPYWRT
jgi:hypothetical protein